MLKQVARASLQKQCLFLIRNVCVPRHGFCTYEPDDSRPLDSMHDDAVGFDEENLKFIVCPVTKKPLRYDSVKNMLISDELAKAYPILNGIPNLLPSSAVSLDEL
uniref:Protein preY, mitochondrial n=1 Tax=Amblyomma tuberculatum TaxID=48802 RepID=A0A6M2E1P0_9ACAR